MDVYPRFLLPRYDTARKQHIIVSAHSGTENRSSKEAPFEFGECQFVSRPCYYLSCAWSPLSSSDVCRGSRPTLKWITFAFSNILTYFAFMIIISSWRLGLLCSAIWRHAAWCRIADISEERAFSAVRVSSFYLNSKIARSREIRRRSTAL
jgi:hypothetical protein